MYWCVEPLPSSMHEHADKDKPCAKEVPHVCKPLCGGETDRCHCVRRKQEEKVKVREERHDRYGHLSFWYIAIEIGARLQHH